MGSQPTSPPTAAPSSPQSFGSPYVNSYRLRREWQPSTTRRQTDRLNGSTRLWSSTYPAMSLINRTTGSNGSLRPNLQPTTMNPQPPTPRHFSQTRVSTPDSSTGYPHPSTTSIPRRKNLRTWHERPPGLPSFPDANVIGPQQGKYQPVPHRCISLSDQR